MRANGIRIVVLGLCLLVAAVRADVRHDGEHAFYVTSVVPNQGNTRLLERFVDWLSQHGGYPLHLHFVSSYDALSDALRREPTALGWTCGAPFVQDHARDGQQLVVVPLFRGQPRYHSVILTARERSGEDLTDFAGAVFAYSDPRSNSGFLVPASYLQRQGQDIHAFFRLLLHVGSHERSIQAVSAGLADVAAVDEYVWVLFQRDHPAQAAGLREVMKLGPYPFTPIVAGRQVPAARIRALRATLASMAADPQGRAILDDLALDGFVIRDPAFYEPLARMLDETERDGH